MDLAEQEDYEFPHPVQRWVMPLVLMKKRDGKVVEAEPLGTSFAIANSLLVTAAHVLDPFMELLDDGEPPPDVTLGAVFLTDEPAAGRKEVWGSLLTPNKIAFNHDHDLALLGQLNAHRTVEGRPPYIPPAPLTIDAPEPGARVFALGYSESRGGVPRPGAVNWDRRVTAVRGNVEEVHPAGRPHDSLLVRWPAFRGDFPAPHGLSGGPILTEDGRVCGLVSFATDPGEGRPMWTSYGALLPFLFTMSIELDVGGETREWSLQELADRGIVPTDGSHAKIAFVVREDSKIDFVWRK